MQSLGLVARFKRKYVRTTDSAHNLRTSPNLLDRQFEVKQVNKVWVSDITYIPTDDGWRYLTVILDLADRAVVSWTLSKTMQAEYTVIKAFMQALGKRSIRPKSGLMFHSDRGVQYACEDFRTILDQYGVVQSMSRKGNCWDNAVAESFFKTIKTEELDRHKLIKASSLNSLIFKYIEGWYNTQRIHSSLGGKTPWETFYEKNLKLAA
jgi:transposase InsO family protein